MGENELRQCRSVCVAGRIWRVHREPVAIGGGRRIHSRPGSPPPNEVVAEEYRAFMERHQIPFDDRLSIGVIFDRRYATLSPLTWKTRR